HDVFISFRRQNSTLLWMKNHFYPLLNDYLLASIPPDRQPSIFIDWTLDPGTHWPSALCEAAQCSRLLVAVLSGEYFRSEWCLAEWRTFTRRSELIASAKRGAKCRLIYPVLWYGKDALPDEAKEMQYADFSDYTTAQPIFRESRKYVEFDDKVKEVV